MIDRNHVRSGALSILLVFSVISAGFLGNAAAVPSGQSELATGNGQTATQTAPADAVTCQLDESCPVADSSVDLNNSGAGVDVLIDGSHQGSTFTEFANRLSERGYDVDTKR